MAAGLLTLASALPAAGPSAAPPAERRGQELLAMLRNPDEDALREYVERALHPSFLEMAPLDAHVEEFGKIRRTLGDFRIEEIRLSGPDRADFLVRAGSGESYLLHLETEPIEPFRLAGIGLQPHDPDLDIPEFSDLEQAGRHLEALANRAAFSGVVLVAREGEPEWIRAYGFADRNRRVPNTAATLFDLGSITKALTAVAVLQLVERGRVDLQAPMGRYLKGFPPEIADRVKVIDLLRMESGYGDYFNRAFEERRGGLRTISDYLELFRTFSLEFEPGTKKLYSNVGYVILGGIVESVTDGTYQEYVKRNIYEAAGMTSSSFRGPATVGLPAAIGYTRSVSPDDGGGLEPNSEILEAGATPAGGSYSSATDLLRFNRALRANRLLSEPWTTFMLNGFQKAEERPAFRGVAGGAPGVSTVSLEDVREGVTVIVLSNFDEPIAEDVGRQIFRMLTGRRDRRAVPQNASPGALPMRLVDSQPAIEVMIDAQGPFLFLIDTGAAGAGRISRDLARRLSLEPAGQVMAGDPSGRNTRMEDLVRIESLRAGDRSWSDVRMLLAPKGPGDRGIDGILGFELFRDMMLTLDYPKREVRFEAGELPPVDGRDIIAFTADQGIPTIELEIAGRKVPADLDSGSMGWLMVPEEIASGLPLLGEPRVVGRASTGFNEFDIKAADLGEAARLGRHELDHPRIEIAGIFPRANIGGQLLGLFSVTFDQKNGRVRFAREDDGPVTRAARYRVGMMMAEGPDGLIVQDTVPGSPAARAGLLGGDRITRVNGIEVPSLPAGALGGIFGRPDPILLEVDREGRSLEIRVTPERVD